MKHFHNILIVNYLMLILCFDMFILDTTCYKIEHDCNLLFINHIQYLQNSCV